MLHLVTCHRRIMPRLAELLLSLAVRRPVVCPSMYGKTLLFFPETMRKKNKKKTKKKKKKKKKNFEAACWYIAFGTQGLPSLFKRSS